MSGNLSDELREWMSAEQLADRQKLADNRDRWQSEALGLRKFAERAVAVRDAARAEVAALRERIESSDALFMALQETCDSLNRQLQEQASLQKERDAARAEVVALREALELVGSNGINRPDAWKFASGSPQNALLKRMAFANEVIAKTADYGRLTTIDREELRALRAEAQDGLERAKLFVSELCPETFSEFDKKGTTPGGWRCIAHDSLARNRLELKSLREELTRLREDANRLEWLEKTHGITINQLGQANIIRFEYEFLGQLRPAIDAAIKAEKDGT